VLSGTAEEVVGKYLEKAATSEAERLDRAADQSADQTEGRWGSRRVEINAVRILGADAQPQSVFQTGQPFSLEIDYIAHQPTPSPIFGMAIHHHDGTHITGPNSATYGLKLPVIEGSGTMRYAIPVLPLLDGLYHISVAVVNQDDTETFDYHSQRYTFRVWNTGDLVEQYGLVTLGGNWEIKSR